MNEKEKVISYDANSFEIEGTILKKSKCQRVQIVIPDGVTEIGEEAFRDSFRLEVIKIPHTMKRIGKFAFLQCYKLREIHLPTSVEEIEEGAFYACKALQRIQIPWGVHKIAAGTFEGCSALTKVELSDNMVEIGPSAFHLCTKLKNIEIPSSVRCIKEKAFLNSGLTSIHIPLSVEVMGSCALGVCEDLTLITCEAERQPEGWSEIWKSFYTWTSDAKVVWGSKPKTKK